MATVIFRHVLVAVAGLLSAAILIAVGVMWFEGHPIADYKRVAWPETIRAGGTITIAANVTRSKSGCSSTVRRQWLNEVGLPVGEGAVQEVRAISAGVELFTANVVVPKEAPLGPIVLRTISEFYCNPVQQLLGGVKLPLNDLVFEVIG